MNKMQNSFIKDFKSLWAVMDRQDRSKFIRGIGVNLVISFLELVGVSSLIPFLGMLSQGDKVVENPYVRTLIEVAPGITASQIILISGIAVILSIFFTNWLLYLGYIHSLKSSSEIVHSLTCKLYRNYVNSPYSFHTEHGSTLLATKLGLVSNLGNGFLFSILNIVTRGSLCLFIIMTLLWVNPYATVTAMVMFSLCYFLFYKKIKNKIRDYGYLYKVAMKKRNKVVAESLRGIKDVIVCRYQNLYEEEYDDSGKNMWRYAVEKQKLAIFPRYILETIAFGGITFLAVTLAVSGKNFVDLVPQLTLFTVLGYKLLPACQVIYANVLLITAQAATFDELGDDLLRIAYSHESWTPGINFPFESLELKDITFTYKDSPKTTLKDISLTIKCGERIGIVGASGSGKTTLIDLILGLFEPQKGTFSINGAEKKDLKMFDTSSYVPQSVYILNASLEENITMDKQSVDIQRLNMAIYISCLDEVIKDWPHGVKTSLREDGSRLSGGQRQRVGLARAIYRDLDVLVLDEATSALDKLTERTVYKRLEEYKKTVIIITHKVSSLRNCDNIYVVSEGEIIQAGSYQYLLNTSEIFKTLSELN